MGGVARPGVLRKWGFAVDERVRLTGVRARFDGALAVVTGFGERYVYARTDGGAAVKVSPGSLRPAPGAPPAPPAPAPPSRRAHPFPVGRRVVVSGSADRSAEGLIAMVTGYERGVAYLRMDATGAERRASPAVLAEAPSAVLAAAPMPVYEAGLLERIAGRIAANAAGAAPLREREAVERILRREEAIVLARVGPHASSSATRPPIPARAPDPPDGRAVPRQQSLFG